MGLRVCPSNIARNVTLKAFVFLAGLPLNARYLAATRAREATVEVLLLLLLLPVIMLKRDDITGVSAIMCCSDGWLTCGLDGYDDYCVVLCVSHAHALAHHMHDHTTRHTPHLTRRTWLINVTMQLRLCVGKKCMLALQQQHIASLLYMQVASTTAHHTYTYPASTP